MLAICRFIIVSVASTYNQYGISIEPNAHYGKGRWFTVWYTKEGRTSSTMKKAPTQPCKCLIFMVRLEGFEPPTYGLEVRCSIQLSYRRLLLLIQRLLVLVKLLVGYYMEPGLSLTFPIVE